VDSPVIQRVVQSGALRIGMTGSQPPFTMRSRSGEWMGLDVDLAKMLAGSMGARPKFVRKAFAELLPALDAGEVDVVISGVTITPQRNMKYAFVGPYMISGKSILTTSKLVAQVKESGDLDKPNLKLAALRDSTSQLFVEKVVPQAKLMKVKDYDEGVALVRSGKADALVADLPICLLTVLRNPKAGLATLAEPLTIEPIGIGVPAGDPLFVNLLTNLLGAMQGTGVLKSLQDKWFASSDWLSQLPDEP